MSAARASFDVLTGGEWMIGKGGVARFKPHTRGSWRRQAALLAKMPKLPQRDWPDLHELRACTSCPARVDEACRQPNGERAKHPHVGRLTPRLCRCGNVPRANNRRCDPCLRAAAAAA